MRKKKSSFLCLRWSVFVPADGDSVKEKTLYIEQPLEAVTAPVPVSVPVPVPVPLSVYL